MKEYWLSFLDLVLLYFPAYKRLCIFTQSKTSQHFKYIKWNFPPGFEEVLDHTLENTVKPSQNGCKTVYIKKRTLMFKMSKYKNEMFKNVVENKRVQMLIDSDWQHSLPATGTNRVAMTVGWCHLQAHSALDELKCKMERYNNYVQCYNIFPAMLPKT